MKRIYTNCFDWFDSLIHWFLYLSLPISSSLFIYLYMYLFIYLRIDLLIFPSLSLSLYRYIYLSLFPHSCHLFHVLSPSFSTRLLISFSLSSPSNSLFSSPHLFYVSSSSFFSFSTPLSSLLFISLILFSSIFPTLHFSHSLRLNFLFFCSFLSTSYFLSSSVCNSITERRQRVCKLIFKVSRWGERTYHQ